MSNTPFAELSTDDFTFLSRAEYFTELTQRLQHVGSGDRVTLAAMGFELTDQFIPELVTALGDAATNGADVAFAIDAYAITYADRWPMGIGSMVWRKPDSQYISQKHRAISQTLAQLADKGVRCAITNQPRPGFSVPFVGRSHIKAALINDEVYIGGVNLHKPAFADLMVHFSDGQTARWLRPLMNRLVSTGRTLEAFGNDDIRHAVDASTEILIDVGVKRQSIILDEALALIDRAQDWLVLTCQFFPNDVTAQALKKAHQRGVQVRIIFNNPRQHQDFDIPLQYLSNARERLRMPQEFFKFEIPPSQPLVHAKLLASETEAMVGSHNYVRAGVLFGTAEMALHRHDAVFASRAAQNIVAQVGLQHKPDFSFLV